MFLSSTALSKMLIAIERVFVFILLIPSNIIILATDYCKMCKKGSHTLCRYAEGPADRCKEYKKPEFTTSVKKYIVDVHNDIRNHIASGQELKGALGRQPTASNMNSLQWDNELAEIAQRWADQCIDLNEDIQHDECRQTERFQVGQNVLTAVTSSLEIPEIAILILNWYKQVKNVLPSDIEHFSGIQRGKYLIGQYTQLVWAETRFFGCGMSAFRNPNTSSENSKYLHRLVCNYGPRGNLIGASVYEKGIPCLKCPFGRCDSVRTSLCEGTEESDKVFEKYNSNFFPETKPNYHVEIPMYLFTSTTLGYMLKHNLTEFVQSTLQNIKIYFGHDDKSTPFPINQQMQSSVEFPTETFGLDEVFTLSSTVNKLSSTKVKGDVLRNKYQSYFKSIEGSFKKDLKNMANLLNREDHEDAHFEPNKLYELDNGEIVVDGCKEQRWLCQYEGEESVTRKIPESGEIVFPDNSVYKIIQGTWFHGRCRCNYVYRSAAGLNITFIQEFIKLVFTFIIILK